MNSKVMTLTKRVIENSVSGWVSIRIIIKEDRISVAINKKTLIKD